ADAGPAQRAVRDPAVGAGPGVEAGGRGAGAVGEPGAHDSVHRPGPLSARPGLGPGAALLGPPAPGYGRAEDGRLLRAVARGGPHGDGEPLAGGGAVGGEPVAAAVRAGADAAGRVQAG